MVRGVIKMVNKIKGFCIDCWNFNLFKRAKVFTLHNPINRKWLSDGDLSCEIRRLTFKEHVRGLCEIFKVNFLEKE